MKCKSIRRLDSFTGEEKRRIQELITLTVCKQYFIIPPDKATPYNSIELGGKIFPIRRGILFVPIFKEDFSYLDIYLENKIEDAPTIYLDLRTPRDKILLPLIKYIKDKTGKTTEFTEIDKVIIE